MPVIGPPPARPPASSPAAAPAGPALASSPPTTDVLEAAYRVLCAAIMRARAAWPGDAAARARVDAAFLDLTHHACQALAAADDPEVLPEVQHVLVHEAFLSAVNLYALTLALVDDAPGAGGLPAAARGGLEAVRAATIDLIEAYRPRLSPPDDALRAVLIDGVPVREALGRPGPR